MVHILAHIEYMQVEMMLSIIISGTKVFALKSELLDIYYGIGQSIWKRVCIFIKTCGYATY